MAGAFHPAIHDRLDVVEPKGHVLASQTKAVALVVDPVKSRGAVASSVRHLPPVGHVASVALGGGIEFGVLE